MSWALCFSAQKRPLRSPKTGSQALGLDVQPYLSNDGKRAIIGCGRAIREPLTWYSKMHQTIFDLLDKHIASHTTAAVAWPDDAEFCVVYNTSTWPCGWGKEAHVEFFKSQQELNAWVGKMRKWSRLEDNYYAFQAYRWDLGPRAIQGFACNTGNLGWTYEQRQDARFA